MSEHLRRPPTTSAPSTPRSAPGFLAARRGGGAGQAPQDLSRRRSTRPSPPSTGAPSCSGSSRATAGSRPTSASWTSPTRSPSAPGSPTSSPTSARPSATSSGWSCSTSTRTPRSPRPSCSPGCSPAPTRRPGSGTPSPRSATPTRRSTAGAARRCPTSSTSPRPSRPPDGGVPVLPAHRQPALRPRASSTLANRPGPARSTTRSPQVAPLVAKDGAAPGVVQTQVFETHRDELAALVERGRARPTAGTGDWSRLGVLTRDNAHAEEVFDALTGADVPVEIVGLSGLLRLPEVAEIVATLHLLHDVTANASLLTLLTGPRWAVGPRDLHLLAQRAGELSGGRGRAPEAADIGDQLLEIADGIDPAEVPALGDALEDPGADLPYSTEARERFALLAGELRMLRAHVAEPLLDVVRRVIDTTGVDVELASAVGPAAAGPPRQPRPVRQGGRRVPGGRRRRQPARAAGLPHGRGRPGQRPRRRDADRGRLGQAAHGAPVQGPRVALGVPRRRGRDPVPVQPRPHPVDLLARR